MTGLKSLWLLLLIMLGQSCLAGIYKCQVNGKTVYQDGPCDAVQPQAGKIKVTTPELNSGTSASGPSQPQSTYTPPSSAAPTAGLRTAPAGAISMSGSLDELTSGNGIGISAESALKRFGRPQKVNRTTTASGVREQWVYDDGQYVYVENGRVTAIQQSEGRRR